MYRSKAALLRMQALLTTDEDNVHDFLSVFAPDLERNFKSQNLMQSGWGEEKFLKGMKSR